METAWMREVMKRRKDADANKAAGEWTSMPRPPPPPPKKVQPITVVTTPKATGKRPRIESEQGSANHRHSSSPSSRVIPSTDGFRFDDARSLRVVMNYSMSLLRSTKNFSDILSKKTKEFADLEAEHERVRELLRETQIARKKADAGMKEAENALETARADLKAAVASRELVGQELNRISKEHTQYVLDMAVNIEDLEFQQASAYIRGYETAMEHIKFKTPDYDFTDLRWDTELKDGRLVTGGDISVLNMIDDVVGREAPEDKEVQQEAPQQKAQQGTEQI